MTARRTAGKLANGGGPGTWRRVLPRPRRAMPGEAEVLQVGQSAAARERVPAGRDVPPGAHPGRRIGVDALSALLIACLVFVCLAAASLGSLLLYDALPPHHRPDDTQGVIRLLANIFVVMTSLVLGSMITSAKSRYDAVGRDVHAYATDLILLDRTLLHYGPQAGDARSRLRAYVERAADGRWTAEDPVLVSDGTSERLLRAVGDGIRDIGPAGAEQTAVWNDARQQHRRIVEMRWALVERAEGSIPMPLLGMVVAWLMLIFGSFGYRAPRNVVVTVGFVVSSALIAGALYLILDLDSPFDGPVEVSHAPLQRALAEMRR